MKALYALLLFLLLSKYNSETCSSSTAPGKVEDCTSRESEDDKDYCCFLKIDKEEGGKNVSSTFCKPLNEEEYQNITKVLEDEVKNNVGKGNKVQNANINCSANYLIISILSLIILFI